MKRSRVIADILKEDDVLRREVLMLLALVPPRRSAAALSEVVRDAARGGTKEAANVIKEALNAL